MEEKASVISVDIGGATCKIGRVDEAGNVSDVSQHATADIREKGLDNFIDLLREYEEEYLVEGITIALPATVDWEDNYVRSRCADLPWMEEATALGKIQDELGRPVQLVNDVEALLVGEWLQGELSGMNSGVVISLGENMGSALLWGGKPQQGRRGSIMELEHVSLETEGEVFEDLPPGSALTWLSGKGLKNQMKKIDVTCELPEFFTTDNEDLRQLRGKFELKLAHLLGTVIMMLDPERIVLTGGLTGSYKQWLSSVKDQMQNYIMEQFKGLPVVTLGQLREDDVLKGPAAFWRWQSGEKR